MPPEALSGRLGGNLLAALLFLTAATTTLDTGSTVLSSPWTAENFGADPDKAQSMRSYRRHAIVLGIGLAIGAALIARSWWPVVGSLVVVVYLYWLYERALRRGAVAGSEGWAKT